MTTTRTEVALVWVGRVLTTSIVLVFSLSFVACGWPEQVTPRSAQTTFPPQRVQVDKVEGTKLGVIVYDRSQSVEVDITDLSVDLECAKRYVWPTAPKNLRLALLQEGCAKITGSSPKPEESQAQKAAQDRKMNVWTTTSSPTTTTTSSATGPEKESPPPAWLKSLLSWLASNWLATLSAVFALLAIPGFIKWLKRRRYRRSVDVVLFGLNSAGKTDLWTAWADGSAPNSDTTPSTETRRKTGLMPVPCGEYTLLPNVVDGVGGDPSGMLDSMRRAPRRHKRVLIFVVAPRRENKRHDPAVDPSFVIEQTGYSAFPRALIGAKDARLKPDLVIVFFSKFDLLASAPSDDTSSCEAKESLLHDFGRLMHAVERECLNSHVPFDHVVGSSKRGWHIEKLRNKVAELIFGRGSA